MNTILATVCLAMSAYALAKILVPEINMVRDAKTLKKTSDNFRKIIKNGNKTHAKKTEPHWLLEKLVNQKIMQKLLTAAGSKLFPSEVLRAQQTAINCLLFLPMILSLLGTPAISFFSTTLILIIATIYIPQLCLMARIKKRQRIFQREIPYLIDMLSMCVSSGMNMEKSFEHVSTKLKTELGSELKKISILTDSGFSFEKALEKMKESITIKEYENLATNIIHSKKLGVSMSKTLDIQSELIRTSRRQRAEHASKTATIKITFPLVCFIFPALLIIYIAPGLLKLLYS